jgi:hypothetical protein
MPTDRPRPERWREAAKRAIAGHHRVLSRARPGTVYTLKDELVVLPEHRLPEHPERSLHPKRRVILVQAREWAVGPEPLVVLVVPTTASFRGEPGPWDFAIPDGEPGFTAEGVVAVISLLQPVLKTDLERCEGSLRTETLLRFQAKIAAVLGLQPGPAPIRLPERAT